jgi:alanyl-tRNA synthetase
MVQFKHVFLGGDAPLRPRADSQKCSPHQRQAQRLEQVGRDTYHHTLLRDARQLVVRRLLQARGDQLGVGAPDRVWKLPKDKLYATVHTTDDEAAGLWRESPTSATTACCRFDEENFWEMARRARAGRARRSTSTAAGGCDTAGRPHAPLRRERGLRALHGALEPRLHPVQPERGGGS